MVEESRFRGHGFNMRGKPARESYRGEHNSDVKKPFGRYVDKRDFEELWVKLKQMELT